MERIRRVDHVGIAVTSIADSLVLFRDALGARFLSGGDNDETGIRLVHLGLPGFKLELMQPLRQDCVLQRHLDKRGPGFHHMTFFVDDLQATVKDLRSAGFPTTDSWVMSPRSGIRLPSFSLPGGVDGPAERCWRHRRPPAERRSERSAP